jgi:hypothetical protein
VAADIMTETEREEIRAYIRHCRGMTVDEILKWHEERWKFLARFQTTLAADDLGAERRLDR